MHIIDLWCGSNISCVLLTRREDLVDAIKRMGPRTGLGGQVSFAGWARMALPIAGVSITEVSLSLQSLTCPL